MSKFAAWTRLDRPGCDAALLRPHREGSLLQGAAAFDHDADRRQSPTRSRRTPAGRPDGDLCAASLATRPFGTRFCATKAGWRLNGVLVEGLEHLVDLDYGFTPATNALQLVRIALQPGQRAEVPVAWFDLDSATLIELPQIYERRGETSYWYEAPTVPYQALLEIAPNGFVQSYPGLWRLVA